MESSVMEAPAFFKQPNGYAPFYLRPLQIENDIPIIHNWVNRSYARYWQMQNTTVEEVRAAYITIMEAKHSKVFMGFYDDQPAFLLECYWVINDPLGNYYDARPGDYGFHILVAPAEKPIHNFTWQVFTVIIDFMLSDPAVDRLVVEPDARNEKIHALNRRAGFEYQKVIELPNKTACLAFCTRQQYVTALQSIIDTQAYVCTKKIENLGVFSFRLLQIDKDIPLIHEWVNKEYARYWQMQNTSIEEVRAAYLSIMQAKHSKVFMGYYNDRPAFLWESYHAMNDVIGNYYDVQEGDYGLHLLVAPVETPIHNFTWHILKMIIDFMLIDHKVQRLIVEPDVRNEKMHVLTKRVGFEYHQKVQLPQKMAWLAFCTREQYRQW